MADTLHTEDSARTLPPIPEDALIILPVRQFVLFPGMVFPITVGRPRTIAGAQARAYEALQGIRIDGAQFRSDIGHRAIKR